MDDIRFAIAVLASRHAYPIRARPEDAAHNALKRLGTTEVDGGVDVDGDDVAWREASLDLLNLLAPNPGDHHVSEGEDTGPPPAVEANAVPWYAVFEDPDSALWVARFFGPNLPGLAPEDLQGIHIVDTDPGGIDIATLTAKTRARRSVIMLSRGDIVEEGPVSGTKDHGGGGGVIKTEW